MNPKPKWTLRIHGDNYTLDHFEFDDKSEAMKQAEATSACGVWVSSKLYPARTILYIEVIPK